MPGATTVSTSVRKRSPGPALPVAQLVELVEGAGPRGARSPPLARLRFGQGQSRAPESSRGASGEVLPVLGQEAGAATRRRPAPSRWRRRRGDCTYSYSRTTLAFSSSTMSRASRWKLARKPGSRRSVSLEILDRDVGSRCRLRRQHDLGRRPRHQFELHSRQPGTVHVLNCEAPSFGHPARNVTQRRVLIRRSHRIASLSPDSEMSPCGCKPVGHKA